MSLTPKEVRALWADDLENGGHKQGTGRLYTKATGGWCCMGRLQQLAVEHGVVAHRDLGMQTHPDWAVTEWAGLNSDSGAHDTGKLTDLNDDGFSFAEIAAIIRAEPEGLCFA